MPDQPAPAILAARTFPQFLHAVSDAYGDALAVTVADGAAPDDAIGYAGLERRSAALARGLVARGIGKGARIGFACGNGPLFVTILAAIARIGAVAVPVSTLLKADELVRVLRQSDVAGLIVQRRLLGQDMVGRLCDALPELRETAGPAIVVARVPYLRWVLSTGPELPPAIGDVADLETAAAAIDPAILAAIEREVHPADQMIELYTSGSMALPKGVRHDHGPVLARTRFIRDAGDYPLHGARDVPLPLFWVGGLIIFLMPTLASGGTLRCTAATPTSSRHAMGSVLATEDLAVMQGLRPFWALGMSETLGPYSWGDELRAPGRPLCAPLDHVADGYEMRIVDAGGAPVADGAVGEIQVRGDAVTRGVHKIDRADHFTPDGFLRTGDLAFREGTRVHFVGRDGDMIKTAGANVSPAEVEMELQALDGVHSAYVVGLTDAGRGQLVAAAIVPRDGAAPDHGVLERQLRQRLSAYKVPRAYVTIAREEVPMLFSNKVARRQVRSLVARKLGRPE